MNTGTCLRPSYTAMVVTEHVGIIIERHDQLITFLGALRSELQPSGEVLINEGPSSNYEGMFQAP